MKRGLGWIKKIRSPKLGLSFSMGKPDVAPEFKFEGFVVLGFFISILYLFFGNVLFVLIGSFIMFLGFFPGFNLRRFLRRDIFYCDKRQDEMQLLIF